MKWLIALAAFLLATVLVACGDPTQVSSAPAVQSGAIPTPRPVPPGQSGTYAQGYALPASTTIYSMTGEVLAAPGSISQYSFSGSMSASSVNGYGSASGYISGGTSGKGFVRFKVARVTWHDPYKDIVPRSEDWTPIVKDGDIILLKTEDTKASALGAGDVATFLCREDQEFVAPAAVNEIPTLQSVTRELDSCRMVRPQFAPPKVTP